MPLNPKHRTYIATILERPGLAGTLVTTDVTSAAAQMVAASGDAIAEAVAGKIQSKPSDEPLSAKEAAKFLGVSFSHWKDHVRPYLVPIMIGRRCLYDRSQLLQWREQQKGGNSVSPTARTSTSSASDPVLAREFEERMALATGEALIVLSASYLFRQRNLDSKAQQPPRGVPVARITLGRVARRVIAASLLCLVGFGQQACGGSPNTDWNIEPSQPAPPAPLTANCLMVTEGVCGTPTTERPRWDCPDDEFDAATTTYTWGVVEGSCESLGIGTRGPAWTTWCCDPIEAGRDGVMTP